MQTRFGYNVLKVTNRERLWRHCGNLPPGCIQFYNSQGDLAWLFKADFKDWIVVHRHHPDHNEWQNTSAEDWYRKNVNRTRDGVILHTQNEVGFLDGYLDWTTELIKLARPDDARLVVLNLAVGHPEPDDWKRPAARRLLEEMAKDGDKHYMGLHSYFPSNITGLINGTNTPSNPTPVIQDPAKWPKTLTDAFPAWLCGRYHFLYLACDEMGIPRPKVLLTEVGTAEIGAVDSWQKALPKTEGFFNQDGWKANREVWRQWWPFWTHEQAYAEQMLYGVKTLWSGVEGVLVFSWGDDGGWDAFDIADAVEFQDEMERGLVQSTPIPVPPVDVPFPDGEFKNEYFLAPVREFFYVREFPRVTAATVETVHGEILCMIAEHKAVTDGEYQWFPILNLEIKGWFRSDVATFVPYKENPMPDPTPNPTPAPAPTSSILAWVMVNGVILIILFALFLVMRSSTALASQDVSTLPISLEQAASMILATIVAIVMGAAQVPVVTPLVNLVKWGAEWIGLNDEVVSADRILLGVSTLVTIAIWFAGRVGLGLQLDSLFAILVTVLPLLTQLLNSIFGSKALYADAVRSQVSAFGYQRTA